ncbi:hypothetical protein BURKHO8Y_20172 [Burkholderia sp. 8Y]|nr:hypothetical protein BURKHO8Y_20172 [Burkholderia sp. 8Y]
MPRNAGRHAQAVLERNLLQVRFVAYGSDDGPSRRELITLIPDGHVADGVCAREALFLLVRKPHY